MRSLIGLTPRLATLAMPSNQRGRLHDGSARAAATSMLRPREAVAEVSPAFRAGPSILRITPDAAPHRPRSRSRRRANFVASLGTRGEFVPRTEYLQITPEANSTAGAGPAPGSDAANEPCALASAASSRYSPDHRHKTRLAMNTAGVPYTNYR